MAVLSAHASKPRPGGMPELIQQLSKGKTIAERHGAVVYIMQAMAAGPVTGTLSFGMSFDSMTVMGAALATMTKDPAFLELQAERMNSTAFDSLGHTIIRDIPGFEAPISKMSEAASLSFSVFEPRPDQRAAMADLCASYRSLFAKRGMSDKFSIRQTVFSGGPMRFVLGRTYDGGVAELMEALDASVTDPEIQTILKQTWDAGLAPVSTSTWARLPL
jgi:hypothetical protein